jgi:flotillin
MIGAVSILGVALGVGVVFLVAGLITFKRLFRICGPNEVLVFSGGRSEVEGRRVGYRIVKGGSSLRRPLVERVARMDLTNMTVDLHVKNAYSKGGIPLTVQGVANLKIAGHQPLLHNALERFLGMEREDIIDIAKDTLEGNLRGVLSQLTPEEVNQDKQAFAEKLLEEAEHDLARLGLVLDVLKIQNVVDEVGYLTSIGRKQSAELQKRARIAEADAKAESVTLAAENRKRARAAQIQAETEIARAEAQRRITDALTRRAAVIAEESGRIRAAIAKAQADMKVQEARVEQVRRQLDADVVAPAKAAMERLEAEARARASKITEEGKATAAALARIIETWKAAGPAARDIFLMQKLPSVLSTLVDTIQGIEVRRITVLPDGADRVSGALGLAEQVKAAFGVDLVQVAKRLEGREAK